jgi:hypothetical protein
MTREEEIWQYAADLLESLRPDIDHLLAVTAKLLATAERCCKEVGSAGAEPATLGSAPPHESADV